MTFNDKHPKPPTKYCRSVNYADEGGESKAEIGIEVEGYTENRGRIKKKKNEKETRAEREK